KRARDRKRPRRRPETDRPGCLGRQQFRREEAAECPESIERNASESRVHAAPVAGSAESAGAEPAGAEPAGAEPAGAEPAGAEPAGAAGPTRAARTLLSEAFRSID